MKRLWCWLFGHTTFIFKPESKECKRCHTTVELTWEESLQQEAKQLEEQINES